MRMLTQVLAALVVVAMGVSPALAQSGAAKDGGDKMIDKKDSAMEVRPRTAESVGNIGTLRQGSPRPWPPSP